MYGPTTKYLSRSETQGHKTALQVYKEACHELGRNVTSSIASSINDNTFVLKADNLMDQEIKSLKLLFDRHHFQTIALYKETPEMGDVFDPKTVSLKPKYYNKSPQLSISQKSFSRLSSGSRPSKSPQGDQKKTKGNKVHENVPIFCKCSNRADRILINQLSTATNLEVLKFFSIKFSVQALTNLALGIKENHSLKELSIVYCDLTSQEFEYLYGAIGENNNLYLLDLSHNNLDDDVGRMIGSIISIHGRKRDEILWVYSIRGDQPEEDPELKGICDFNLSHNQLGSRALKEMCGPLKYDTWLRVNLNLRGNQIGEEGVIELRRVLDNNNSLFAIDLRENPFFNPKISKEIVNKLTTNIRNYKEKNLAPLTEESSHDQFEDQDMQINGVTNEQPLDNQLDIEPENVLKGWDGDMKESGTFNMQNGETLDNEKIPNPIINEEIDELIKKYEGVSKSDEETKDHGSTRKIEGVSFGFRNEKIKEKLRKDYKKLRVKHTRSEGKIHKAVSGEEKCINCRKLEKKLLMSESRSVNMLLENYKLKKKLNAILQAQNSWSAISPQLNEMENTSNIPHPESISQDLFKRNITTLGDQMIPESDEVFNRIENLMAELTRMMDNLENGNATNNFTGHFTNSTHLTNNNTYQLINSANNIHFNSTTNILNSNNNSRIHALATQNLQQTISMHQVNNRDVSKSFSRIHQQKNNQHLNNYSEQIALSPRDKSENQESKAISQFSLSFQNENSHMNQSNS